jgi:hypothetical protein
VRHAAYGTLAWSCPTIQRRHRNVEAALINKFIASQGNLGDLYAVLDSRLLDPWGVALTGVERLFFRGKSSKASKRHITD